MIIKPNKKIRRKLDNKKMASASIDIQSFLLLSSPPPPTFPPPAVTEKETQRKQINEAKKNK